MNTHSIDLVDYRAQSRGNSILYLGTAGSHGNEQLQVTQGKGWEGLTIHVFFHPSQVAVQLPANGLLDVPWEATAQPLTAMQGRIVFQGFDQDRLVNSTDLAYTVASHSPTVGRNKELYTPGIVESVLNQMAADKDAILQAAQQTSQAKEAAAASAAEAAGNAANAQQSAGAANISAGQAAASASQVADNAAAACETLAQIHTAGQEAQQKVKDAETEALDKIVAAAPALPAVSTDAAWQSVTVGPDGTGYNLAALAPIEATIRPTVTGNPAICENSATWGLQGLKIYGKSTQVSNQLLPLTKQNYSASGMTGVLQDDGSLIVNGTPSLSPAGLIYIPLQLSPGNYYISGGEDAPGCVIAFVEVKTASRTAYFANQTFSINGTETSVTFLLQAKYTDPINNYRVAAMLNTGTHYKCGGVRIYYFEDHRRRKTKPDPCHFHAQRPARHTGDKRWQLYR